MRTQYVWLVAALVGGVAVGGCSDDSSSGSSGGGFTSGGGGTSGGSPSAVRSATCVTFQDAVCDWSADKCKVSSRADCDSTAQSLFCKADSVMQACIDALATAPCGAGSPSACANVADTAPAQAACNQFSDQICTFTAKCMVEDKTKCLMELAQSIPCANAVGIAPSFSQCQADLDAMACPPAGQKASLPASCNKVVKVSTASAVEPGPGWHAEVVGAAVSVVE